MVLLEAVNHIHPIWYNVFFYLFIGVCVVFGFEIMAMVRALHAKTKKAELMEHQYAAKINVIRKENEQKLDDIRVEMLKREEERSRQWMESEKETLRVLNGVSNLLDLEDKFDKSRSEEILKVVSEIREKVEKLTVK